jgi:hypothetical protein
LPEIDFSALEINPTVRVSSSDFHHGLDRIFVSKKSASSVFNGISDSHEQKWIIPRSNQLLIKVWFLRQI